MSTEWQEERADVLKQIALMQMDITALKSQTAPIAMMQSDIAIMRAELTRYLSTLQVRSEDTSGQVSAMQLDCVRRGEQTRRSTERLDKIEPRIDEIEESIASLKPWLKAATFIASGIGAAIVALLWALLTGSATIVIK